MLTLMLLRHAKAAQHSEDDRCRVLTGGGRYDARALGVFLEARGLVPDHANVSTSTRTRETFRLVEEGAGRSIEAAFDESLYNATGAALVDKLRHLQGRIHLVVGHNPGILDAAIVLGRHGDFRERHRMQTRFPPCGLAVLSFDAVDWFDARSSGGHLDLFVTPESLSLY